MKLEALNGLLSGGYLGSSWHLLRSELSTSQVVAERKGGRNGKILQGDSR